MDISYNSDFRRYSTPLTTDGNFELVVERPYWSGQDLTGRVLVRAVSFDDQHGGPSWESTFLGDLGLTSMQDRQTLNRTLVDMFDANDSVDDSLEFVKPTTTSNNFLWVIGDFFSQIIEQENRRNVSKQLSKVSKSTAPSTFTVEGLTLVDRHCTILFGDGETAKSLLALWLAGRLAQEGRRVLYLDWELSEGEHRTRLEQLFGDDMPPQIYYMDCKQPLPHLVDVIRGEIQTKKIDYVVIDSLAFAAGDEAEKSGTATAFFAALKDLANIGSLCIAHNTKSLKKADIGHEKPFGSVFWHNGARATYLVKSVNRASDQLQLELKARKANLHARSTDIAVTVTFDGDDSVQIIFADAEVSATAVTDRILAELKAAPGRTLSRRDLKNLLTGFEDENIRQALHRLTKKNEISLTKHKKQRNDDRYSLPTKLGRKMRGVTTP